MRLNMASKLLKFGSKLLKSSNLLKNWSSTGRRNTSTTARTWIGAHPKLLALGAITGGAGLLLYALDVSVSASGAAVHPPRQQWGHLGLLSSLDAEGVRRGYNVYKNVCASCHSLQYIAYRNLVNVCMTEAEAKAEAEAITVRDGPDEEGNFNDRPGKLSDYFPSPYPNEEAARSANNGAYPPDLSYIVSARKGGEDYIFALLTGYCDPPAGYPLRDGQFFNPYFDGGNISMGKLIDNEVVTYEDSNIPASASQIAKDVCTFLKWTSEPEGEARKRLLIKVYIISIFLIGLSYYIKRFKWSTLKSRKIFFIPEVEAMAKAQAEAEAAKSKSSDSSNDCPK